MAEKTIRKRRGHLLPTPLHDSPACSACAADCCRGFPAIELSAGEYARLKKLGARRLEFTLAGRFYLLIDYHCEFLEAGRCSIYADRPHICRFFACDDALSAAGRVE